MSEDLMCRAIEQAQLAYNKGEVPIGAVIVDSGGKVIAAAHNLVESKKTQTAHAELLALEQAAQSQDSWRLEDCTIYVTLEPCAMCMSAILLSRVKMLIFASSSPIYGYRVDNHVSFAIYNCPIVVREGVCEAEASGLLRSFFQMTRKKGSNERKKVG